jgi:hypothetical protein
MGDAPRAHSLTILRSAQGWIRKRLTRSIENAQSLELAEIDTRLLRLYIVAEQDIGVAKIQLTV